MNKSNFTACKSVENQFRINPDAIQRLVDALNQAYTRKVLNVHWAHIQNDRAYGVDAFLETDDCNLRAVDFKFRRANAFDAWVNIETLGNIAKNQIGWAGKVTKARDIVWIRFHQNGVITEVVLCNAERLRELVTTRISELREAGEARISKSDGKHGSWMGEFVAVTPSALKKLLPVDACKHVIFAGEPL